MAVLPSTSRRAPVSSPTSGNGPKRRARTPQPRRMVQFLSLGRELDLLAAGGTEALALDAARRCMIQYGAAKMSMVDVARVAGISRGSVYKYFPERELLVAAVVELAYTSFTKDMDDAMAACETLEDQLVAAAMAVRQWDHAIRTAGGGELLGDEQLALLVTRGAEPIMRNMMAVLTRYLDEAEARSELRPEVDTAMAAEWVARILHSLSVNPAIGFDPDDPGELDHFIRSHLLHGFGAPTHATDAAPRRGTRQARR